MQIEKKIVFESETGQIIYTKTKQLRTYLFTEKGFMFNNNHHTVKFFPTSDWPKLAFSDIGRLVTLARHLEDGNRITLSAAEIAGILGLSVKRTYKYIRRMIDSIVIKRKGRFLYINPTILFAGRYMSRDLYLLFKEQLDPVLPSFAKMKFQEELP